MGLAMQVVVPKLVVTGGCPIQRAALSEWLHAQGFSIADLNADASSQPETVVLFLCSGHDPADELTTFAAHHAGSSSIALLFCNCERALATARSRALPNVFCADESPERLAIAIRAVCSGQQYRSPSFEQFLTRDHAADSASNSPCRALTPRELDVLRLLAHGHSKKRIAEVLHLSVKTVDNHSTSIMSKLNIHNRVDLARYAIREGLATA